jgi:hypothetical protein
LIAKLVSVAAALVSSSVLLTPALFLVGRANQLTEDSERDKGEKGGWIEDT